MLVVENVRLLAVNQLLNRGEDVVKMANVSIEVESKQSQAVILASQLGRMHLVLRHPEDNQMLKFKPLGSNTFFGGGGPSNGANNGSNS